MLLWSAPMHGTNDWLFASRKTGDDLAAGRSDDKVKSHLKTLHGTRSGVQARRQLIRVQT
jgi:hypothetical protein